MKNHIEVNGKLLQTNKRFSQLKESQKNWIVPELYKLYHNKMKERRTTRKLPPHTVIQLFHLCMNRFRIEKYGSLMVR